MNQTFSLTRFTRLHRWLWASKGRTYLIGLSTLIVVGCLYLSRVMNDEFSIYDESWHESFMIFYLLLSCVLVVGIGSDVFSALFRQESAISYLMLPASRTEKFWLGVLYALAALLVFTVAYFGYEAFAFSVANSQLKPGQSHYISSLIQAKPDLAHGRAGVLRPFFALALMLSVALLGSFYFRRGVLTRNVGVILVLFLGLTFLYRAIVGTQFSEQVGMNFPLSDVYVAQKYSSEMLTLPPGFVYAAYVFLLLALWVIARVRFNEIER